MNDRALARRVRVKPVSDLEFAIQFFERKRKESEKDMAKKECSQVEIDWLIDWAERQVASRVCQEKKKE